MKDLGPALTNRVANTAKFWESQSESNDSPHNSPRLHASCDKSVVSSLSMPPPPGVDSRRSRRDLSSTASTTSKSFCFHLSLPPTLLPVFPCLRLTVRPGTVRHLACIGIEQDAGAVRSRSSSPPLRNSGRGPLWRCGSRVGSRTGDMVADDRLRRIRSPTSSLLLNGKNKNETDERKVGGCCTSCSSWCLDKELDLQEPDGDTQYVHGSVGGVQVF